MSEHLSGYETCVPKDWSLRRIKELTVRVGSGVTPRGGSDVYLNEGVLFIRSQNVRFEGLDLSDPAFIDSRTHRSMHASKALAFDVLLNITGASIGRCCVLPEGLGEVNVNLHVCTVRLENSNRYDAEFLSSTLASPIGQNQIFRFNAGGNREGLNYEQLRGIEVPWPKPFERQKIARILTALDNVIEKTEALIAKCQAIKQGMMHDLFTRGIDSSGTLRPTQLEAPELYAETRIGFCPKVWKQVPLFHYADVCGGVTLGRKLNSKLLIELPYLRVANVQDGYLDLSEIKTVEVLRSEVDKYKLKAGDVVMTEGGDFDKLGRGTIWQGQIADCLHQNHVFRIRPKNNELLSPFLAQLTGSAYGRHYFLMCAKQTTNLASINASQVKAFPLLLPAPEEQAAIIAKVDAIDGQLASETAQRNKLARIKSGLMQDLLTGKVRVKVDESAEVAANA